MLPDFKDEAGFPPDLISPKKIYWACWMRGRGYTHDQICRHLGIKNQNALVTVLRAYDLPDVVRPGVREIRVTLSHARYADLAAMTRQAGYQLETGIQEFLEISAKDRVIRDVLEKLKR
jgi:hypothetical protein